VLSAQCLSRRISDAATLECELRAWQAARNAEKTTVSWHFTTQQARPKLRHLYPVCTQ
jgi:hypothetical protein